MDKQIITQERRVWDALLRGDVATDHSLLHPDFISVYADGFSDRDGHTGQLADGPTIQSYDLHDIKVKSLGLHHALICYRASFRRMGREHGKTMYVSSIWRKENGNWINIFSQDTPAA